MRDYAGPLLIDDLDELPASTDECSDNFMHSVAKSMAISSIVLGATLTLTRRKMTPTHQETPGVVSGHCYGSSHHEGGIVLMLEQADGECIGVDVSEPELWHWQVNCG